ncbi:MAG: peptide antibiotic transporter SbmA, partial [Burkholderiaceae bacterium]
ANPASESNADATEAAPDAGAPAPPSAEQIAHLAQTDKAQKFWLYQFQIIAYIVFVLFWLWFSPHKWSRWSVLGSALIIFVTWFLVQIDVEINAWFRTFFDTIQKALAKPNSVTAADYYGQWVVFGKLAMTYVVVIVLSDFFTSHYVFRWRTAMNEYYMSRWQEVRHIEGASQRVQEDTMRLANILESLGVQLIRSIMTLIAFLPILWGLSSYVKELPIIGAVPQALVIVAIIWSIFGTGLLALVGIKLPGLQFRNQRVEAAYRKELVIGEDDETRAQQKEARSLFANVRTNYFRLYFHYLYFNVIRYSYFQVGVLVPYIALAPTILVAGVTLGVMQQILHVFNKVENSFQYLINSWTTIVELMSIYKRLEAFEAAFNNQPLPDIDREFLESKPA